MPIHEPGLLEIIARTRAARRITFSTDIEAGVAHGEVQFIAVGTPPDEDGSADLQYVLEAARNIGRTMNGFKVIVDKSTVPVGTAQRVRAVVEEELAKRGLANSAQHRFSVVSNPEFLKEGAAVDDFMRPDRIVLGSDEDEAGLRARELMKRLYAPFNRNHERTLYMDVRSAEFTKYAANAMLATRISFMNEMSNLADRVGADIEAVRRGIGSDPRIGYHFLYAGCGYGGSCFPKDVQALIRTAAETGHNLRILEAVEEVNYKQKDVLVRKITGKLGEDLSGRTFAVWGLAFKPNTDDMREAPSRRVIAELLARGAQVRAYDPVAVAEARRVFALDLHDAPDQLARLKTPFGQRIAQFSCTFSIGIALTASIVNKRAFTYGFERLRFPNPVFIGDTIHTKVTIKEKKDDPKRPEYGQVNEACEILNQNDKCVCYSEHILLVERKKV